MLPRPQPRRSQEEEDVALAMRLSAQEEEERQKRLAEMGNEGLFDEQREQPACVPLVLCLS